MAKQKSAGQAVPTISGDDVTAYRAERAKRVAQGKPVLEQPSAPKQEEADPVKRANALLALAVAQGMTGKPLEDLKRTLLANLSQAAGIHVVSFPHDVEGIPPGFRVMDVRYIIPNVPTQGPKSGRLGFLNVSARGVWNGKAVTLQTGLYEYQPDQTETVEEQAKRRQRAVAEATFTIPQ